MTLLKCLEVHALTVRLATERAPLHAVTDATLEIFSGETVALIGESGCGKSVFAQTLFGLLAPTASVSGSILLEGQELTELQESRRNQIRGRKMCFIFQDALRALNPFLKLGVQLDEVLTFAGEVPKISKKDKRARISEVLRKLNFSDPQRILQSFAHELSGGMRQRVVIAMTLLARPRLIVADEPTTALDTTVQMHVLDALLHVQRETRAAMLFITHNLGVAAAIADKICVMYAGRFVEISARAEFFRCPSHPYSRALIDATPSLDEDLSQPLSVLEGQSPDLRYLPTGCAFAPRCERKQKKCEQSVPPLRILPDGPGQVACWFPLSFDERFDKVAPV